MTSKLKTIFSKGSKAKPEPKPEPKPDYTPLQDDSDSIFSTQPVDEAEQKKRAWEAKRAKEAEEYLYRHGYVSSVPCCTVLLRSRPLTLSCTGHDFPTDQSINRDGVPSSDTPTGANSPSLSCWLVVYGWNKD